MMKIILDKKSLSLSLNKIKKLSKATNDFRPFLQDLEGDLKVDVRTQFDTEGQKFGEKWAPLKQSTIIQRVKAGYGVRPILKRTGKLRSGTRRKELTKNRLVIGNSTPYYKYHQLGTRKMPRRQILLWSMDQRRKVIKNFQDYINKIIRNG